LRANPNSNINNQGDPKVNHRNETLGFLASTLLIAGLAVAAQPPDAETSDAYDNTALGSGAVLNVVPNLTNGPIGNDAAQGVANTGLGYVALGLNSSGSYNTGIGAFALYSGTTGEHNTGLGYATLASSTTGSGNTAIGHDALEYQTVASQNSALGAYALQGNATGSGNTAAGYEALAVNSTGANNTAFGATALYSNTTGKGNAAQGVNALYNNTTGLRNLGIGSDALYANTTGSYNIGLGYEAGYYVTTGSNNIEIGALGTAGDNNTIQIGVQGTQTFTTIAGIYGTMVTGGSAVYVTSTGQLGVQGSSERFKTDIATMPELSAKLQQLRPVTFHYKTDPKSIQQYGLIAEEVDRVYPELVIRDDAGKIQGVRYEELAPMLLHEIQSQAAEIRELKQNQEQFAAQAELLRDVQKQLVEMRVEMRAKLLKPHTGGDELVAQR
jgi:hypothetical protein